MSKETILLRLRQRSSRSRIIGWGCFVVMVIVVFLIETDSIAISGYLVLSAIILMSLIIVADFAFYPVPKCPKCENLLKFALKLSQAERAKVSHCPYCAADLNVEA